jgi:hypothetical protein
MCVVVLSDALFLSVVGRLLSVLRCDSNNHLVLDNSRQTVQCWQGSHALWGCLSLAALSFYIPTSVMLAPMLVQGRASSKTSKNLPQEIVFVKLFAMVTTVLKCFSLIVALLAYSSQLGSLGVFLAVNVVMLCVTVWWVQSYGSDSVAEPCTSPLFARFKAMVFASAVWACVWVAALSSAPSSLRASCLSAVLPAGWTGAALLAWVWNASTAPRDSDAVIDNMQLTIYIDKGEPIHQVELELEAQRYHLLLSRNSRVGLPRTAHRSPTLHVPVSDTSGNLLSSVTLDFLGSLTIPRAAEVLCAAIPYSESLHACRGVRYYVHEPRPHRTNHALYSYTHASEAHTCSLKIKEWTASEVKITGAAADVFLQAKLLEFGFYSNNDEIETQKVEPMPYPFCGVLVSATSGECCACPWRGVRLHGSIEAIAHSKKHCVVFRPQYTIRRYPKSFTNIFVSSLCSTALLSVFEALNDGLCCEIASLAVIVFR